MRKIFLIFSIFSFLSLGLFAQKTEVSENFDAMTGFTGNWTTTGSWVINTTSLETTHITSNVKNAYLNDNASVSGDIIYSYSLPENPYDNQTPTRTLSFYWLTDMSSNANADLNVIVETSPDNSTWTGVILKVMDTQASYDSVVDASKSIGAADWATYSAETNATKKWRHAIIPNISVASSAKYLRVRFNYQSVFFANGGGWYVDNVEVTNTRPTSTMDFFEDFNNISFSSGEWSETNADNMYGWVDSTVTYDVNNFPGNTNAAYVAGTNLAAQDETITFTHNLETKPDPGVKKWELSFFWRTDMSLNNGNAADITIGLQTSTDGTTYGTTSTIWKEDDQSIFESTVDGTNSEDNTPTWSEYQAESSSTWKWYHAKVDLTSYIGSNVQAIKLILNYKGQFAGDFMMDGLMLAKTANPEYSVDFALNNYETVPLEQVDTNGYTINYSVVNNGTAAANSTATLDLHVQGPSGTYNGNTYKQFTISTVAGADASGSFTFDPASFIQSGTSGTNIVGTYNYWITGSVTTSNGTTTFTSGNNGGSFKVDLNNYSNYASNAGGGTVTEDTISKGFGSIFYLRNTDHFKGIIMDRTTATQTNKVKYYVYKVDDLNGTNPVFVYEADPSANETQTIATMDDHVKLSAGYYMVFVTAYDGSLAFYTDTTESANTAYFTGKPNNWTKVTGQGDIALTMQLRENQAFKFSSTAGMLYNAGSLVLNEGVKVDFRLKASDPDDDPGTFDFTGAPSWVTQTANTDTSVTVSMLPTRYDVGTYSFSVDGTDGKVADNYNISVEVKDTKVLDATTDNYTDNFAAFGDWTNVYDYNLDIAAAPAGQHWTVTGGHMQISCDKDRDQKEVLYTPLYGVPVSNSSDKLLLFFTWQFDNLSNTGAADIVDIQIDMYKKGGAFVKTVWQDDDTTTIGANSVKGQHFSSMQDFNAENKIINAYEAATEYTTMIDLTANIADSIYFVITYTSPVTSATQTPIFWFDNFKVNYVPAVLDLKVDNNSGYPENKYTQIPLYQAADLMYMVDVQNLSNVTKTGNSLVGKVTNTANSDQLYEVYTYDVSPLATTNITLNTKLQPRATGTYTFTYGISDDAGGDLSGTSSLGITSNEMALDDNGLSVYTKQNDKSNSVGAKFILRKDDYLQKVKAYINYPGGGKGYTFSVIQEGTPNSLVWTSNVYTTAVAGAFNEFTLDEPVKLAAGTYYLMVNDMNTETATSLQVGVDDNADNMGKYYRGDLNSIYEATDYTNTTYPDYKGDLMVRMILYNNAPDVAAIADQNATENKLFSVQVGASDKEGDAITFNITNKPTWLSFNSSTLTFSGTPSGTDAGDHYVEFYASDGRDSTVNTFKITVAKDPLPYFTTVPVTELVDGQTYNYTAHAADFDGQVVTISTEGSLPTGLTATGTPGTDATYTVTGTLAVGQHFVQLRATDSNGGFVVQSYMINVTANNAPYFISKGITHTYSGEAYNLNVVAKDDNSSDVLAITADTTLPTWLSLTDNGDGTAMLSGTAPDSAAGTSTIKLQVADNFGATDSLVFDLTVEVRQKPVITAIPDTTVKTLQVFSTMVSATDANGDEVVISAVSKPNWLSFAGLNDGTAKLNGTPTEAGTYTVALLASDGYLMSDTVSFTITVIPNPNNAPVLGATPDTTIVTGTSFKYTVSATDADGDELKFIGTNIPSWLNIQDNMDGTADIIGEPDEANIGVHTVTVGVTDGVNSVEQSFTVTVNAAKSGAEKSAEVRVYPNPSKQYITIDNAEKATIKIFSLSGKLLKETTNANIRQNIDVSGINPGIYLIKINKEGEIITQKINIVK